MKPNNEDSKLSKILAALLAGMFAALISITLVCLIDGWEWMTAGAEYETSLVTNILGTTLIVAFFMMATAFVAVLIYKRLIMMKSTATSASQDKCYSLLQGAAKGHEKEIIALLQSVAQPLPGKDKLNRARTAQLLRAMIEMGLIDANIVGKRLMLWVEDVTNYTDGNNSAFNQALKDATAQDTNVIAFQNQLEKIVSE